MKSPSLELMNLSVHYIIGTREPAIPINAMQNSSQTPRRTLFLPMRIPEQSLDRITYEKEENTRALAKNMSSATTLKPAVAMPFATVSVISCASRARAASVKPRV
jgi:hypothetical protein